MSTITPPAQAPIPTPQGYPKGSLLADWLSSTDHKVIGGLLIRPRNGSFTTGGRRCQGH